jgi:4,5-dihydroxyphthalate decarboxylase
MRRAPTVDHAVCKAFNQAKGADLEAMTEKTATKVKLPFVVEQLKAARETMGQYFWAYGVGANRAKLDA